jgi:hypothetical protein
MFEVIFALLMDQTQTVRAMRSFHLPVVCKEKKIPKVVFVKLETFCQTGIGLKEMIFFSSLFCLSRRERLFFYLNIII